MTIRPARVTDLLDIATIHVQTWQVVYKGQIPDEYLANLSIEDRHQKWLENFGNSTSTVLVAEIDGKVRGFCDAGKSRDNDSAETDGEVYAIYLHHEYLRMGVGSSLFYEIEQVLRKKSFSSVTLWVLDTNLGARKFYETNGWYLDGGHKTEVREGFSLRELRYRKNLV